MSWMKKVSGALIASFVSFLPTFAGAPQSQRPVDVTSVLTKQQVSDAALAAALRERVSVDYVTRDGLLNQRTIAHANSPTQEER